MSVQNPLIALPDAVTSVRCVLDRMGGPTVLVGHSCARTIISEVGVHANVASLVYAAARARCLRGLCRAAKSYPPAPASAGIVFDGDEGRLSEQGFCATSPATCRVRRRRRRRCSPPSSRSSRAWIPLKPLRPRGGPSRASTRSQPRTGRSIPTCNASWPRGCE